MEILGVQIGRVTADEATSLVVGMVGDGQRHYIVTPNPEFLVLAHRDRDFKKVLNGADLAVPDGVGLSWASLFLDGRWVSRITGVGFLLGLCAQAEARRWKVFLLGAAPGVAENTAEVLVNRYPGLQIVGTYCGEGSPVFDQQTREAIKERVAGAHIDLLFVAYGHGKQERWIARNLSHLPVSVAVGVGGAFDFISGRVRRAPRWWRWLGLEWLWRFFAEPWRAGRTFNAVVVFPLLVLRERLVRWLNKKPRK